MGVVQRLAVLALRGVVCWACETVGGGAAAAAGNEVVAFRTDRFTDHGLRLITALQTAQERAWIALEVALAGEPILGRLDQAEDQAFRQQIRAFLDASRLAGIVEPAFRQRCHRELRAIKKKGVFRRAPACPPCGHLAPRRQTRKHPGPQEGRRVEWPPKAR